MTLQSRDHAEEARRRRIGAAAAALAVLTTLGIGPARAGDAPVLPKSLTFGGVATVVTVIDGDTLTLADGRTVRLVGIAAPKPPLDAEAGRRWPFAEAARAALSALARGRQVTIAYGGAKIDRYGRVLAQLYRDDGLWLQGALLDRGLARVVTEPDNRALAAAMLAREAAARADRRGIWSSHAFAVRTPGEARYHVESFEIVEGRVVRVWHAASGTYLAMGDDDPKRGLTVVLLPGSRRLFRAAGLDPKGFAGRRLRVRGWIRWWRGPRLEVNHPEQIELLTP